MDTEITRIRVPAIRLICDDQSHRPYEKITIPGYKIRGKDYPAYEIVEAWYTRKSWGYAIDIPELTDDELDWCIRDI